METTPPTTRYARAADLSFLKRMTLAREPRHGFPNLNTLLTHRASTTGQTHGVPLIGRGTPKVEYFRRQNSRLLMFKIKLKMVDFRRSGGK